MALGRLKGVYRHVLDASQNQVFLADRLRSKELDQDSSKADALDFLEFPTYTVSDGVDGAGALQDGTVNQIGLTNTAIDIAEHPAIFLELGAKDMAQLAANDTSLAGFSAKLFSDLRNEVDRRLLVAARAAAYTDPLATYHDNVGGDALTKKLVLDPAGKVQNAGSDRAAIEIWANPMAIGSFAELENWTRGTGDPNPQVGASMVGSIGDIPVIISRAVPYRRTMAISAGALATNVATLTVPTGHGIVAGMRVSTTGLDENIDPPGAVVSDVTSTTIIVPFEHADDATMNTGTLYVESAENLVIAKDTCHTAMQLMPSLKLIDGGRARVSDVLKIWALFGLRMRVSSVRILHTAP